MQNVGGALAGPHGGEGPVHQQSTCITQFTLGPCVVQIWSRNNLDLKGNETLVHHRSKREVAPESLIGGQMVEPFSYLLDAKTTKCCGTLIVQC